MMIIRYAVLTEWLLRPILVAALIACCSRYLWISFNEEG
jgi:hypothetical protein